MEDGDGVFDRRLGGDTLDRLDDDLLGLLVGGHLCLLDDLIDVALRLVLSLGTKALDETLTSFVGRQLSESLETLLLALTKQFQFSLLLLEFGLLHLILFFLELDTFAL